MKARRYQPVDFVQIAHWAEGWNTTYTEAQFPKVGFIVDGYAAYFLYSTDSSVCFLENLISNRHADHLKRKKAIELVCDAVLKEAAGLGFKVAYATTSIPEVIVRAINLGATVESKQTLLTKTLTSPSENDG